MAGFHSGRWDLPISRPGQAKRCELGALIRTVLLGPWYCSMCQQPPCSRIPPLTVWALDQPNPEQAVYQAD